MKVRFSLAGGGRRGLNSRQEAGRRQLFLSRAVHAERRRREEVGGDRGIGRQRQQASFPFLQLLIKSLLSFF